MLLSCDEKQEDKSAKKGLVTPVQTEFGYLPEKGTPGTRCLAFLLGEVIEDAHPPGPFLGDFGHVW